MLSWTEHKGGSAGDCHTPKDSVAEVQGSGQKGSAESHGTMKCAISYSCFLMDIIQGS